jgi:hypothetical protein
MTEERMREVVMERVVRTKPTVRRVNTAEGARTPYVTPESDVATKAGVAHASHMSRACTSGGDSERRH